jgi:hypothetical protein
VDTPFRFPVRFSSLAFREGAAPCLFEAATATVLTTAALSGTLEGPSMAGFSMGDPLLLQQARGVPRDHTQSHLAGPLSSRHSGGGPPATWAAGERASNGRNGSRALGCRAPRRSPRVAHFCSFRLTHTENTIWRRAKGCQRYHPRRRRAG